MSDFRFFNWEGLACPVCGHRMMYHSSTGQCRGCDKYCLDFDPTRPAKVRIYKERGLEDTMSERMWKGGCAACFRTWKYWDSGATLGIALEHTRRCSRFRYALSLDPTYQSGVSLRQRISSSSGRQRPGSPGQPSPPLTGTAFTLPEGYHAIAEVFVAPFGRCKICRQPLRLRVDFSKATTVKYCDAGHGRE